jgi:hypothetical protein
LTKAPPEDSGGAFVSCNQMDEDEQELFPTVQLGRPRRRPRLTRQRPGVPGSVTATRSPVEHVTDAGDRA